MKYVIAKEYCDTLDDVLVEYGKLHPATERKTYENIDKEHAYIWLRERSDKSLAENIQITESEFYGLKKIIDEILKSNDRSLEDNEKIEKFNNYLNALKGEEND